MRDKLSNMELAARFNAFAETEGEAIWNRQLVVGNKRFSYPLVNTTRLARHFEKRPLDTMDPSAWVVDALDGRELRLYLRVGEEYGEGWVHHFIPPIKVAINSPQEFMLISPLARNNWWQAEFVCPFCDTLCWKQGSCSHLLISHHWVNEPYRIPALVSLLKEMRDREFNCNMLNANLQGLIIKVPRNFVTGEWFRFAYWYIRTPELIDSIVQVFLEGKKATYWAKGDIAYSTETGETGT